MLPGEIHPRPEMRLPVHQAPSLRSDPGVVDRGGDVAYDGSSPVRVVGHLLDHPRGRIELIQRYERTRGMRHHRRLRANFAKVATLVQPLLHEPEHLGAAHPARRHDRRHVQRQPPNRRTALLDKGEQAWKSLLEEVRGPRIEELDGAASGFDVRHEIEVEFCWLGQGIPNAVGKAAPIPRQSVQGRQLVGDADSNGRVVGERDRLAEVVDPAQIPGQRLGLPQLVEQGETGCSPPSESARLRYAAALCGAPRRRAASAARRSVSTTSSRPAGSLNRRWAATSSRGASSSVRTRATRAWALARAVR